MHLRVLYVVMGCSGTSVHSTKVRSRTSRWVVHSSVHHDENASVLGLRELSSLDEKVVELHFPALGSELTVLNREQVVFMVVEAQGPFKDPH